jgi:pimeloyl-ACP methyl ester carboxylesterase
MPRIDGVNYVYPGAQRPERSRRVDAYGADIAVYEWGPRDAPPLPITHGGFDFAATFDVLAPLLVDRGYRVVAWDHRGHGDSQWCALYSWQADLRDAMAVLDSIDEGPLPVIGHSKGGLLMTDLAVAAPGRVTCVVNIDGLPSDRRIAPDVNGQDPGEQDWGAPIDTWLDQRRAAALVKRKPGAIDDLARRRGHLNPRLPMGWLRYLAAVGARRDQDGWRWKLDPSLHGREFGPWRLEWLVKRMSSVSAPFLGLLSTEPEPMGWGTTADDVASYLPRNGRVEVVEGGHFLHLEQPEIVADLIVEHVRSV